MKESFEEFKKLLIQSKRVLISTHALPDGDGLGAESALFHYLKRNKKTCRIYNPDLLPRRYRFLDPKGTFLLGPGEVEIWDTMDLWIIVDTNDPKRVGTLWNLLANRARRIIFLDHHQPIVQNAPKAVKVSSPYPPHCLVVSDPNCSSIGELLYRLFVETQTTGELSAPFNRDIALGLYVSVMTDTNSFRYSGTTPAAHRIAAHMIELGVNPEEVYQTIYSTKELSHVQLLGKLLEAAHLSPSGKIAWISLSAALRNQHKASADDTLSFLNLLLLIRDAEVVCLFREEDSGKTRISLKSKGRLIVNQVALDLGGGGHLYAAGAVLDEALEPASKRVIGLLEAELARQKS